ncbi:MAG TPA: glycosyltransferase family 4 protein [Thermoflexia bacterium]|nr:glycosyltransferase family 4 protein [Thermoflexia bacterium]
MQIAMVGPFGLRPRGTMSVRALPMARALARRGHRVVLLLPPWQNPEDAGRCWEEDGVLVENIVLPSLPSPLFHLVVALRLARRALTVRPDVIHLFKPKAYSGLAHRLLAHRLPRRFRLVVDTDDWEGPGGWNDLAPYTPAQRLFFARQERWGLTHADAVTVASRTLESLVWAMGVSPMHVFYVPNGIPDPDLRAVPSSEPVILLYTRFFEFPVERVVELLRRVRARIPSARLLVVGKGLFGEEDDLLRESRRAGLGDAVEYVGWVEPHRLGAVFSRAALAIYPFDDTLVNRAKCPVKLLDLLAAGMPVVAEAVGEVREAIRHGETGWLVEPGDVERLAGAVVRLLEEASLRQRLGEAAAREVRLQRSWDRLVEVVEQAYRGVG